MNKLHPYFGQIVTNDELGEIFNTLASALEQFIVDFGFSGVAAGGSVGQNSTPNLSVTVVGPTVAYDQAANRILIPSVNVPLQLDENNLPTAVVTGGNEKWLSVFAKFVSTPTDPRTDETSQQIYYRDVSSYQLRVAQGSEATIGTAPKPALRGDQVLLADIRLVISQASVLNADISIARAQTLYNLTGTPLSIASKDLRTTLQSIVNAVNAISINTLQVPAMSGSPNSISSGSVAAVLIALLSAINATANAIPDDIPTDVAHLHGGNSFVGSQNIDVAKSYDAGSETVLLSSGNISTDDPVYTTNKWKQEIYLKHTGGQYIRFYSGQNLSDTLGAFAISVNADWKVAAQRWEQRDGNLPSHAIIFHWGKIRIVGQPALHLTPGFWTDWPTTDAIFETGKVIAKDVELEPDVTTTDALYIDGALNSEFNSVLGVWGSPPGGGADFALFPVKVPRGTQPGNLLIAFYQDTTTPTTFQLISRTPNYTPGSYAIPGPIGITIVAISGVNNTGDAAAGHQAKPVDLSAVTFDPALEYYIRWIPGSDQDYIKGMRLVGTKTKSIQTGMR